MREKVLNLIFEAIDEVNQSLPEERRLQKNNQECLYGISGKLDSLGITNLIIILEQKIQEKLCTTISLLNENTMTQKDNPFRNVENLVNYISLQLKRSNAQDK